MNQYVSTYSYHGNFNENNLIIFIPDDISYVRLKRENKLIYTKFTNDNKLIVEREYDFDKKSIRIERNEDYIIAYFDVNDEEIIHTDMCMMNDVYEPAVYIKLHDEGCNLYYFFRPINDETLFVKCVKK